MTFTDEQMLVIKSVSPVNSVNAVAGSGKTSVIVGIVGEHTEKKYLTLCFNKSIQIELNKRCGANSNVSAYTFHGMAYSYFRTKPNKYIADFNRRTFISEYDIYTIKDIFEKLKIDFKDFYELQFFKTNITKYFYSDKNPYDFFDKFEKKADYIKFIKEITNDASLPITHDFYLKIFQLKVVLKHNFDCVIIDEAQDLNSCNFAIIQNLKIQSRYLLGDHLQQLYNFRGAENALEKETTALHLQLSGSFRIGKDIAYLSNNIIWTFLKTNKFKMVGKNVNQNIVACLPKDERVSVICRTNTGIIEKLLDNSKRDMYSAIVGGKESLRFDLIKAIYNTRLRKPFKYLNKITINSIDEAKKIQFITEDRDLKRSIKFVETHGDKTLEYVNLMECHLVDEDRSDFVLTTVHKSKGLEYDNVEIYEDFPNLYDLIKKKDNIEERDELYDEIYILYVAITRSKKNIKLNSSLQRWLDNNKKYYKEKKEAKNAS